MYDLGGALSGFAETRNATKSVIPLLFSVRYGDIAKKCAEFRGGRRPRGSTPRCARDLSLPAGS
jgi:hypothetical protein